MPAARRYPASLPEWIPVETGIQETRGACRFVGADKLANVNLGTTWAKIHRVENRQAFADAWLAWALRRLKEARISAAASRELDKLKPEAGVSSAARTKLKPEKTKPRTARTAGASKLGVPKKCRPNIRPKAARNKSGAPER